MNKKIHSLVKEKEKQGTSQSITNSQYNTYHFICKDSIYTILIESYKPV